MPAHPRPAAAPLESLLQALGEAVASVQTDAGGREALIGSATLLEASDLTADPELGPVTLGDLCIVLGADEPQILSWLDSLGSMAVERRPRVVATKIDSDELARAAQRIGVVLLAVHPQARMDLVLGTVRNVLDGAAQSSAADQEDESLGGENDLYGLAQTVAALTRGLVSIEDERTQLLAYSATDGAADELRMLSILGREGPAEYLRRLREGGVYDRLRRDPGVVEVPPDAELGWRRRLAVDIRPLGGPARGRSESLGTIWLQEGRRPLDSDAGSVLEGAAAIAARLIERARSAPTQEALQIQRLLGLRGGGVDVPSLAAALSLPSTGAAAVVAIGPRGAAGSWPDATRIGEVAAAVRLHASAYARESLVTATEHRIYVLLPRVRSGLSTWLAAMLDRVTRRTALDLRAAVATPVVALTEIGAARAEVDRVLDRAGADKITTLAASRTSVLLGEIADLLSEHDHLRDPRLQTLVDDDESRGGSLVISVQEYLARFGDVRAAAAALHIHPNTLRYRIKRAEQVLGMRLDDPEDRLLLQLQLIRWRRGRA